MGIIFLNFLVSENCFFRSLEFLKLELCIIDSKIFLFTDILFVKVNVWKIQKVIFVYNVGNFVPHYFLVGLTWQCLLSLPHSSNTGWKHMFCHTLPFRDFTWQSNSLKLIHKPKAMRQMSRS